MDQEVRSFLFVHSVTWTIWYKAVPQPAVFKFVNNCAVLLLPGKTPTFGNKVIHELCGQSQQTLGMNEAQTAQNLRQFFEAASTALEEKYEGSIEILKEECRAKLYPQHLLGITHSDARWRVITYEHQTGCEKKMSYSHKETDLLHWQIACYTWLSN